jgi:hypothetical protein|tara:strand:+ start:49 stop:534 length:486 start_codon:yes stop_codon:yes gene_type:complete
MAYLIFDNQNTLIKIALNDADKNCLNLDFSICNVQEVSQSDAEDILFNVKTFTFDGTTLTIVPIDYTEFQNDPDNPHPQDAQEQMFKHATDLKGYFDGVVIPQLKLFINNCPSNDMYTRAFDYLYYLENLDYSAITFPINYSWEKYCKDNSQHWIHPLQIP